MWPSTIVHQQTLSTSITNNPLVFTPSWALFDPGVTPLIGTVTPVSHGFKLGLTRSHSAYIFPTYSDDLFNHFLIVPSILTLGNLLSNQSKTVEIANLYFGDKEVDAVTTTAAGVSFVGLPSFPETITPFGSLIVNVAISATGPPTLKGIIELTGADVGGANPQVLDVPVTGQRITLFVWSPEQFYTEEVKWLTDVIESFDGTEQRIKLRKNPRQVLTYEVFMTNSIADAQARLALFNWLAQVWGVPIWWEQQPPTSVISPGDTVINVNTQFMDIRAQGLLFLMDPAGNSEAFEIESYTSSTITLTSNVAGTYPVYNSKVMPIRTAYAKTQTQQAVYITGIEKITIQFTTLDNVDLSNIAGFTLYQGMPVLDDINYVDGTLSEAVNRSGVIVLDNDVGVIVQQASSDRSRPLTVKTWWTNYASEIWPIRQLFHALAGSQKTFWLPTHRNDMQLSANIAGGSPTFQIEYIGYSTYGCDVNGNAMRPYGDIRITLTDGTHIYAQLAGATSSGSTETISCTAAVSGTIITMAQVARIEFVQLMRVSNDKLTLTHDHPGRAKIEVNCVGVKS